MCSGLYDPTQRFVMSTDGSRVIIPNNLDEIYEMLLLPNNKTPLDEESLSTQFKSLWIEKKYNLLVKLLLENSNSPKLTLPLSRKVFSSLSREVIAISFLIMGYDNDYTIDETILGFILIIT